MTIQDQDQPSRTILVCDLSDGIHVGTLTSVAICEPWRLEEVFLLGERDDILLKVNNALLGEDGRSIVKPAEGNLLVLHMQRTNSQVLENPLEGEMICILQQKYWPADDERFDHFFGALRACVGRPFTWQATISGTKDDPRLGKIVCQCPSPIYPGRKNTFDIAREEEVQESRRVSVPRNSI